MLEVQSLSIRFGALAAVDDVSFRATRGHITSIIGPNGAGKTTLFKMITGSENPDAGTFEIGETVKIAYVDQEHDDLKPEDTVFQAITGSNELLELGGHRQDRRGEQSS